MDRNNLVYDPAAQLYRQNPLDPSGAAFDQMGGVSDAQQNPLLSQQDGTAGPQHNYPAWLTDLSARGLASDWMPAAFVRTAADELHPRDIPPDTPMAAKTAPVPANTVSAPMNFSNGQEGGGSSGSGGASGGDPGSNSGEAGSSTDSGSDVGTSGDAGASGDAGTAGDSGSSSGGDAGSAGDSGAGFYQGGIVSPNNLIGPNPPGPDTGFAALKPGEGVLTDKAMKFYGKGIVAKLNKLAVPKEMFR